MSYEKLSLPIASEFPEEWYDISHQDHFWLEWRRQVFKKLISDLSLPTNDPLHVLEIGCGHGMFRHALESDTQWIVDGADINEAALQKAWPGRGRTLLYNISERLASFHQAYDIVILFDVLEHIPDAQQFLENANWYLKPGGWMFINVPALQSLYSRYDQAVGHHRRYNPESLKTLLHHHDLSPADIRYWGFLLVPLALLRKVVLAWAKPENIVRTGFHPPTRWINTLLQGLMHLETTLVTSPLTGTSLMATVRKKDTSA